MNTQSTIKQAKGIGSKWKGTTIIFITVIAVAIIMILTAAISY